MPHSTVAGTISSKRWASVSWKTRSGSREESWMWADLGLTSPPGPDSNSGFLRTHFSLRSKFAEPVEKSDQAKMHENTLRRCSAFLLSKTDSNGSCICRRTTMKIRVSSSWSPTMICLTEWDGVSSSPFWTPTSLRMWCQHFLNFLGPSGSWKLSTFYCSRWWCSGCSTRWKQPDRANIRTHSEWEESLARPHVA